MLTSLLYCSEVWGVFYFDIVETVQQFFFKKLFPLKGERPDGLSAWKQVLLSFYVLGKILNRIYKTSQMDSNRYIKICFNKYLRLHQTESAKNTKLNWISRIQLEVEKGGTS